MGAGDNAVYEDIADIADPPLGKLIQQVAQSIPDNVATALTFGAGSTYRDSHGQHSESVNTTRVTPGVPGVYEVTGSYVTQGMTSPASRSVAVRLNGTTLIPSGPRDTGTTITSSKEVTTMVDINGTGDYFELMATQDSAGAVNTSATLQLASTLMWKRIGPL